MCSARSPARTPSSSSAAPTRRASGCASDSLTLARELSAEAGHGPLAPHIYVTRYARGSACLFIVTLTCRAHDPHHRPRLLRRPRHLDHRSLAARALRRPRHLRRRRHRTGRDELDGRARQGDRLRRRRVLRRRPARGVRRATSSGPRCAPARSTTASTCSAPRWRARSSHAGRSRSRAHVGADALAHGCTGKGNDQVRFELTYAAVRARAPGHRAVARVGHPEPRGRARLRAPRTTSPSPRRPRRSTRATATSGTSRTKAACSRIRTACRRRPVRCSRPIPPHAPDEPEDVTIGFEQGTPVAVNGDDARPGRARSRRSTRSAARHGVGRVDLVEDRLVGMKSRGVYETPGGTLLYTAHSELEQLVLDRRTLAAKDLIAPRYADLVYEGRWWTTEREAYDAFVERHAGARHRHDHAAPLQGHRHDRRPGERVRALRRALRHVRRGRRLRAERRRRVHPPLRPRAARARAQGSRGGRRSRRRRLARAVAAGPKPDEIVAWRRMSADDAAVDQTIRRSAEDERAPRAQALGRPLRGGVRTRARRRSTARSASISASGRTTCALSKAWAVGALDAGVAHAGGKPRARARASMPSPRGSPTARRPIATDEDVHTMIDRMLHDEVGERRVAPAHGPQPQRPGRDRHAPLGDGCVSTRSTPRVRALQRRADRAGGALERRAHAGVHAPAARAAGRAARTGCSRTSGRSSAIAHAAPPRRSAHARRSRSAPARSRARRIPISRVLLAGKPRLLGRSRRTASTPWAIATSSPRCCSRSTLLGDAPLAARRRSDPVRLERVRLRAVRRRVHDRIEHDAAEAESRRARARARHRAAACSAISSRCSRRSRVCRAATTRTCRKTSARCSTPSTRCRCVLPAVAGALERADVPTRTACRPRSTSTMMATDLADYLVAQARHLPRGARARWDNSFARRRRRSASSARFHSPHFRQAHAMFDQRMCWPKLSADASLSAS